MDSESQNHLRIFQTARISIGQMAANRLSFHLYGLASQDVAESADQDPIPRLYSAYFEWRERKGLVERVKLGRHRVYSGVAYGTIDGVDLGVRIKNFLKVGGFIGLLVPVSNEIEVAEWDDRHAFGLRASTTKLLGTKVLVSYMRRTQRPVAYAQPGRFIQRVLTFESLAQELVGLDVHRRFSKRISAYGRLDYDLAQERVRRGHFEFEVAPAQAWQFAAEFFHRAPFIEANSIFTVFEQSTTQDVSLRSRYQVGQHWFVSGTVGYTKYEGDNRARFGLGLRSRYGSVGYNFRRGYGGQNNGLYAAFNYPLTAHLGLIASTGWARYRIFDERSDDNTSLTGSLGFNYRADGNFSLDFLGQGVRNRVFSNDFRFFLKANYWIFSKKNRK